MSAYKNREYQKLRNVLFWLYDDKCFNTGCENPATDCHHLNKINTDNQLKNLIPVCQSCHRYYDKVRIITDKVINSHLLRLTEKSFRVTQDHLTNQLKAISDKNKA